MATTSVSTPLKSHHGLFSAKTAGGRMPLTPSPRARTTSVATNGSSTSPLTPRRDQSIHKTEASTVYSRSLSRSVSKFAYASSPKSNIAKGRTSPKQLDLGVSEWALTGTGPATSSTPAREKPRKETALRSRVGKTTIRLPHNTADRFIPNRTASTGLNTTGSGKADENTRPRTAGGEGSTVLANAASAFDISARGADADITTALESLGLEEEHTTSYARANADSSAYESTLASACGISTSQRILEFKPAPPESSKPIDLRSQYNRPLKQANTPIRPVPSTDPVSTRAGT